jgi:hypothetical protein
VKSQGPQPEAPDTSQAEAATAIAGLPQDLINRLRNVGSRHHYVPRFLLNRFAIMRDGHHFICDYRLADAKVTSLSTADVAVVKDYNTLKTQSKAEAGLIELFFSLFEEQAAPIINSLVAGKEPSLMEMGVLANFVAAQQVRTPRGRGYARFMMEEARRMYLINQIATGAEQTRDHLRETMGREPTDDEVSQWQADTIAILENDVKVLANRDHEVVGQTIALEKLAEAVFTKEVVVLHAPPAKGFRFVLSDEPLARYDPANPKGNAGWLSSPTFEATLPIDPTACLLFRTGTPGSVRHVRCPAPRVEEVNLRAFAWARDSVFGPTADGFQAVVSQAKAKPEVVELWRPQAPNIYILEGPAPASAKVASVIAGPTTTKVRKS